MNTVLIYMYVIAMRSSVLEYLTLTINRQSANSYDVYVVLCPVTIASFIGNFVSCDVKHYWNVIAEYECLN